MRKWLKGRADSKLQDENRQLRERLDIAESKIRVMQAELDEMAAVIVRNIKRVERETAAAVAGTARCVEHPEVTYDYR